MLKSFFGGVRRFFGGTGGKSGRRAAAAPRQCRPRLESLEDRLALATLTWVGAGGNANWTTAANWDLNRAPGAGDKVVFTTV